MPPRKSVSDVECLRYVALHSDVRGCLDQWALDSTYRSFAAKFEAMLRAFSMGQEDHANVLHSCLLRAKIKGAKLLEYGGVQKGGAPRVFGVRFREAYIFVAAGVEKTNTGCRTIGLARGRANELVPRLKTVKTAQDFCLVIGAVYNVTQMG